MRSAPSVAPDPYDPAAVEAAAALAARSSTVRVGPGEAFTVRSARWTRQRVGYAIFRLSEPEREWLGEFQRRLVEKRRADRERERLERRAAARGDG